MKLQVERYAYVKVWIDFDKGGYVILDPANVNLVQMLRGYGSSPIAKLSIKGILAVGEMCLAEKVQFDTLIDNFTHDRIAGWGRVHSTTYSQVFSDSATAIDIEILVTELDYPSGFGPSAYRVEDYI